MGWNAIQTGVAEANAAGGGYNVFTGEVNRAVKKLGKAKPKALKEERAAVIKPRSLQEAWDNASQEDKDRWLGKNAANPPKDAYSYLLDMWNRGAIDGTIHNDSMRELWGIMQ